MPTEGEAVSGPAADDGWPKRLWVCDHCGHWHGASYNTWTDREPPRCKIKGYGRDGKGSCGALMRLVMVIPDPSKALR